MLKFRKTLVGFVSATMVLGTMGMVGSVPIASAATTSTGPTAASFADVTATTPHASAIEALAALGIVNGVGSNAFAPSGTLTRAEFAKVVDVATGLGTAASLLQNQKTQFSDVPAGKWFTGYIAIAAAKGYVKGYGNGKFGPDDPITYAEMLTVLVRALGYRADVTGGYPLGYIAEANSLGLFSGVNISDASSPVNRADMAQILWNALQTQTGTTVTSATGTTTAVPSGQILAAAMGVKGYYTGTSFSAPAAGDGNIVYSVSLPTITIGGQNLTVASKYSVIGAASLSDLVGHQVSYLVNSTGQVTVVQNATPSTSVVTGTVSTAAAATPAECTIVGSTTPTAANCSLAGSVETVAPAYGSITLSNGASYSFASGVASNDLTVYTTLIGSNGQPESMTGQWSGPALTVGAASITASEATDFSAGDSVTIVLNAAGHAIAVADPNGSITAGASDAQITAIAPLFSNPSETQLTVQTSSGSDTYVLTSSTAITLNGKTAAISNLAVGQIVQVTVIPNSGTPLEASAVSASNQSVTGQVTSLGYANGAYTLTIAGKSYTVSSSAMVSLAGASPVAMTPGTLASLVGDTVTADTDSSGDIALVSTSTTNLQTVDVASITGSSGAASTIMQGDTLTVLTSTGASESYIVEPTATIATTIGNDTLSGTQVGQLVQITINPTNGEIASVEPNSTAPSTADVGQALSASSVANTINIGGTAYYLLPTASVYNIVPNGAISVVSGLTASALLSDVSTQNPGTITADWVVESGNVISAIQVKGVSVSVTSNVIALVTGISSSFTNGTATSQLAIDNSGTTGSVTAVSGIPSIIPSVDVLSENLNGQVTATTYAVGGFQSESSTDSLITAAPAVPGPAISGPNPALALCPYNGAACSPANSTTEPVAPTVIASVYASSAGSFTEGPNLTFNGMIVTSASTSSSDFTAEPVVNGPTTADPTQAITYGTPLTFEVTPSTVFYDMSKNTTSFSLSNLNTTNAVVVFGEPIGSTGTYVAEYVIVTVN